MEVMKQLRQRAIRDLVEQRPIRTQQELAAALRERGFRTTQATISRDVAELGLIKVSREGTAGVRASAAAHRGRDVRRGPPAQAAGRPADRDPRGRAAARRAHPAWFCARDRGRPGPRALAGGGGLHRRRRHALRGHARPGLAPARQASSAAPDARAPRAAEATLATGPDPSRATFDTAPRRGYHSGPVGTSGARLGRCQPGVLSFIPPSQRRGSHAMNNKPTYLSKEGLEKLRAELDEMTSVKRPEVANRIHDAKEHGDLSENAEYEDAKNEQAFVEGRIQTLEAIIKNADDHRREPLDRPRPDRFDGRGRQPRWPGDASRSSARPRRRPSEGRISNEIAGRSRAARQEEGRQGHRPRAGRRHHLQDHGHQLSPAEGTMDWADELAARVSGPQVVNDSKTPSGTVHVGSLRGPVILDVITRALRGQRHRDDAAATASTTSIRWTPRRS